MKEKSAVTYDTDLIGPRRPTTTRRTRRRRILADSSLLPSSSTSNNNNNTTTWLVAVLLILQQLALEVSTGRYSGGGVFAWTPPTFATTTSKQKTPPPISKSTSSTIPPPPSPSSASPLSLSFDDLATHLGGTGKAKACWECFRNGMDPVWVCDDTALQPKQPLSSSSSPPPPSPSQWKDTNRGGIVVAEDAGPLKGWTRQRLIQHLTTTASRGTPLVLGRQALISLRQWPSMETHLAQLTHCTTSTDGTTKLLLKLQDGLEVETVIIPWHDRRVSTVCVSSQVGCRQACTFCSTGRMGLLRNLSADEILAQLYWAQKVCRLLAAADAGGDDDADVDTTKTPLYPIQNVVFMGMGEPADNVDAVVQAARIMVDRRQFQLAGSKVTISTVAPTPQSFQQLIGSSRKLNNNDNADDDDDDDDAVSTDVTLAWSLHSSRNDVRNKLVPTARYTVEKLREGLIVALTSRRRKQSRRLRTVMLEIALLDGINDSPQDAEHLVEFCRPLMQRVPGLRLIVNLIPWNDIDASFGPASDYRRPTMERVLEFQKVLVEGGGVDENDNENRNRKKKILCYIRTTRGDEENAACGMLSTKSKRGKQDSAQS